MSWYCDGRSFCVLGLRLHVLGTLERLFIVLCLVSAQHLQHFITIVHCLVLGLRSAFAKIWIRLVLGLRLTIQAILISRT